MLCLAHTNALSLSIFGRISSIQVMGPRGLNQGTINPDDKGRNNVFYKRLTWTPIQADAGNRIVCAIAEDSTR